MGENLDISGESFQTQLCSPAKKLSGPCAVNHSRFHSLSSLTCQQGQFIVAPDANWCSRSMWEQRIAVFLIGKPYGITPLEGISDDRCPIVYLILVECPKSKVLQGQKIFNRCTYHYQELDHFSVDFPLMNSSVAPPKYPP